jgi:hypothetical protein
MPAVGLLGKGGHAAGSLILEVVIFRDAILTAAVVPATKEIQQKQ